MPAICIQHTATPLFLFMEIGAWQEICPNPICYFPLKYPCIQETDSGHDLNQVLGESGESDYLDAIPENHTAAAKLVSAGESGL